MAPDIIQTILNFNKYSDLRTVKNIHYDLYGYCFRLFLDNKKNTVTFKNTDTFKDIDRYTYTEDKSYTQTSDLENKKLNEFENIINKKYLSSSFDVYKFETFKLNTITTATLNKNINNVSTLNLILTNPIISRGIVNETKQVVEQRLYDEFDSYSGKFRLKIKKHDYIEIWGAFGESTDNFILRDSLNKSEVSENETYHRRFSGYVTKVEDIYAAGEYTITLEVSSLAYLLDANHIVTNQAIFKNTGETDLAYTKSYYLQAEDMNCFSHMLAGKKSIDVALFILKNIFRIDDFDAYSTVDYGTVVVTEETKENTSDYLLLKNEPISKKLFDFEYLHDTQLEKLNNNINATNKIAHIEMRLNLKEHKIESLFDLMRNFSSTDYTQQDNRSVLSNDKFIAFIIPIITLYLSRSYENFLFYYKESKNNAIDPYFAISNDSSTDESKYMSLLAKMRITAAMAIQYAMVESYETISPAIDSALKILLSSLDSIHYLLYENGTAIFLEQPNINGILEDVPVDLKSNYIIKPEDEINWTLSDNAENYLSFVYIDPMTFYTALDTTADGAFKLQSLNAGNVASASRDEIYRYGFNLSEIRNINISGGLTANKEEERKILEQYARLYANAFKQLNNNALKSYTATIQDNYIIELNKPIYIDRQGMMGLLVSVSSSYIQSGTCNANITTTYLRRTGVKETPFENTELKPEVLYTYRFMDNLPEEVANVPIVNPTPDDKGKVKSKSNTKTIPEASFVSSNVLLTVSSDTDVATYKIKK